MIQIKQLQVDNLLIQYSYRLIKDASIKVDLVSANTPIVILHGWNSDGVAKWQATIEKLAILNPNQEVLAINMPGFGPSQPPNLVCGVGQYADFIVKVLEKLQIKQCVLVGHSFGGAVGAWIAAKNSSLVINLILCGAAIVRPSLTFKQKCISFVAKSLKPIISKNNLLNNLLEKNIIIGKIFIKLTGSSDYSKSSGIMKQIMTKVIRQDTEFILPEIVQPTLIVFGQQDTYTPIYQAKLIHKGIKNSKLIILPSINHGIHLNSQAKLPEIITDYIKNQPSTQNI